jgi:hypothetical protein
MTHSVSCTGCHYGTKERYYYIDMRRLEGSSRAGCPVCSLILQGLYQCLSLSELSELALEPRKNLFLWEAKGLLAHDQDHGYEFYVTPGILSLRWSIYLSVCFSSCLIDLIMHLGSFNPFPKILRTACHVPGHASSAPTVIQVKNWLQRCSKYHAQCGPIDIDVPLPTRLIDVASGLRLVETKGMHGRYVCLSHCWGKSSPEGVTKRDSLKASLQSISFETLPKTFRDAVSFTRMLGVQYLWIDSLCIIQDDEADWRFEAGQMAGIYQNAILTLGATAAASDSEGFFSVIAPEYEPIELYGATPDGKTYWVHVRRRISHHLLSLPLFQRGWIYQERLLSSRFLHFTANELIWECKEEMDCECESTKEGGAGGKRSHSYARHYNNLKSTYLQTFTASPHLVQINWRVIVSMYTTLKLSISRDKLPALSGIAKQFRVLRPDDKYLAGLWRASFIDDLLWSSQLPLLPRP